VNRWRSPRFRRRSSWALALRAAGVGIAAVVLSMQNTPDFPKQRLVDRPAQRIVEPLPAPLSRADAADVLATTNRFLRTAVVHKQLRSAYDLVGPELRGGLTRAAWATGENPVIPFPVAGVQASTLAYAYRNDVALDVGLVAKADSDTIA
jgi:hypothetical protein